METFVQVLMYGMCLVGPLSLVVIVFLAWLYGMGWFSIPGIGRRKEDEKGNWTSVPALFTGLTKAVAILSGGIGSVLGFIGFFLPWVKVDMGGSLNVLGNSIGGNIGGQISGIAIGFYSMITGAGLLGTKDPQAQTIFLGLILIVFALFVFLIPVLLAVLAAMGMGILAAPINLIRLQTGRFPRIMLILGLVGSCMLCSFFALLQATLGGVGLYGSMGSAGSMAAGIQPAGGFLITLCGLLLSIFSAVVMISIAPIIEGWTEKLSKL